MESIFRDFGVSAGYPRLMTLLAPVLLSAAVMLLGACSDTAAPQTRGEGDMDPISGGDGGGPRAGEGGASSARDSGSKLDAEPVREDSGMTGRDAAVADAGLDRDASVLVPAKDRDVFGVTELFPTANGGLEWDS